MLRYREPHWEQEARHPFLDQNETAADAATFMLILPARPAADPEEGFKMGPRSRLILLAAVLGASVSCTALAVAQAVGGPDAAAEAPAPSIEYANPSAGRNSGEDNAAPAPTEQVPTFPGGCPFRDNKLELIV